MAYDIGTARGVIEMEYNGRGIDAAQKDLDTLGKGVGGAQQQLGSISKNATRAGLAIAAGLGLAVNSAASFEQRMSAVQSVSGASSAELERLSDKALQLGKDTAFSAGESALAMEELAKAGLTVEEILNGAADATVALAAAGEVDLATAASISAAAMNSFSLEAKDATRVADLMAGAANASATDVTSIGESFKYVAPLAAAAGTSIEDTITGIAALADVGITGSQAGTTLRSMLQRLQPSSEKAAKAMKQLGFVTKDGTNRFYEADGSIKSMADISEILAQGLDGLSDKQKTMALSTIFGERAMAGATAMALKGKKGFEELGSVVQNTSATDVAATRMDNLKGSMEEMKGSLETLGIALGTILIPMVRKVVDSITGLFNKFLNLDEGTQKMIVTIIGIVGALLLFIGIGIKIIMMVYNLQKALMVLRLAFAGTWVAALGPIALVVAAVALIIGILVLLWKKHEGFRNAVIAVWTAIKNFITSAATWIVNFLRSAMAAAQAVWRAVWGTFGPLVKAVWGLIVSILRLYWAIIRGVVMTGVNAVKAVLSAVWRVIGADVKAAWDTVLNIIKTAVGAVGDVIDGIQGIVQDALSGAASWLFDAGAAIIQGLIDGIGSMIGKVTDKIDTVTAAVGRFFPGSPVKEGALKVLNRGHAGQEIVKMLMDGINQQTPALQLAMSAAVDNVAVPMASVPVASMAKPRARGRGGDRRGLRVVSGELRLDPSGRAFIRGVAADADDDNDDWNDLVGRMR